MPNVRKGNGIHINKSLQQLDGESWLIGQHHILRRSPFLSDTATWNDYVDKSSYTLTRTSEARPAAAAAASSSTGTAATVTKTPHATLIHEAGDASAVWSLGSSALCKARYTLAGVTPESVTLEWVRRRKPRSFEVPRVLCHVFDEDRSFLFVGRVPGRTLDAAWLEMDERWRWRYVDRVVDACVEMAGWERGDGGCIVRGGDSSGGDGDGVGGDGDGDGDGIGGVDGGLVPEYYLCRNGGNRFDEIAETCRALGMNWSEARPPVFMHADLGPTNIIVSEELSKEEDSGVAKKKNAVQIGIIDFEVAGFLPQEWCRTKIRLSGGQDLSMGTPEERRWWRARLGRRLGERGFEDCVGAWTDWRESTKS